MKIKQIIGSLFLKLSGWKIDIPMENRVDKMVLIAAPHTSNWDLVYALASFWKIDFPIHYMIKDDYTKGIIGPFFRMTGAIGVNRKQSGHLVHHASALIAKSDRLRLMVPAEGTRSKVDRWKTGFYHIAMKTGVPVGLGYLDYKKKIAGIGGLVYLTGDFEKDMKKIQSFYENITAKYPEQYNKVIF